MNFRVDEKAPRSITTQPVAAKWLTSSASLTTLCASIPILVKHSAGGREASIKAETFCAPAALTYQLILNSRAFDFAGTSDAQTRI